MDWKLVPVSKETSAALCRVAAKPFSKDQTLMACLWWFSQLPPWERVEWVRALSPPPPPDGSSNGMAA